MTRRGLILLAATGSIVLILGAYAFQALGYAPCKMCLWQRWPHLFAIALGAFGSAVPAAWVAALGAGATLTTSGIGLFHTGVERGWWEGPSSCSGGSSLSGLGGGDLLSTDTLDKVVMCDEVSWQLLGLSMASWNAILSLALALVWIAAVRVRRGT